ncbi:MAG: hypothetical protein ACLTSG_00015 [Lachnospiraceae bacterium]
MGESFFDVTGLPGVEYAGGPRGGLPPRSGAEGVSGKFYTHTPKATATENIELGDTRRRQRPLFEKLRTTRSTAGSRRSSCSPIPSHACGSSPTRGYYTGPTHTSNDGIYWPSAREFTPPWPADFSGDFAAVDSEAAAVAGLLPACRQPLPGILLLRRVPRRLARPCSSSRRSPESPVFLWAVTAESRTPFYAEEVPSYDLPL